MPSGAYGASLAGGTFDAESFVKQPHTILRFLSWVFSIVVFATITAEGYINDEKMCIFNRNNGACSYGVAVGLLAFLACVAFLMMDAYFPNISNSKNRKRIVIGDLAFSAVWTFLWFICFCILVNQWSKTQASLVIASAARAARAVITFSFFSIITWALLTYFAYTRYAQGVSEFTEDYTDPAQDHTTPYPQGPYGNSSVPSGYQQSPFSNNQGNPGEYQPPAY
uniref:Synaptogyrin n=1 Tax=Iconisemion striatum TaxID=60296 RepID=A0A1A7Y7X0_9TELE